MWRKARKAREAWEMRCDLAETKWDISHITVPWDLIKSFLSVCVLGHKSGKLAASWCSCMACLCCRLRSAGLVILFLLKRHNWQRNPRAWLGRAAHCSTVWYPKHWSVRFYSWHEHVSAWREGKCELFSLFPLSFLHFTSETETAASAWACNLATQTCVFWINEAVLLLCPPQRCVSSPHLHTTSSIQPPTHAFGNTCEHAHLLFK